jgi:4-hydroxybenzoate polyprenyltransferase
MKQEIPGDCSTCGGRYAVPVTLATDIVPDSERRGFIGALPPRLRPFASLIRLDRPIGSWLLYWPCAWSVALAGVRDRWDLFLWLALGAWAMRSAGCVYNDIVDRDLDRRVERTRLRPLASGRVSLRSAWALIGLLCLIGLLVLLQLNVTAAIVALISLAPVAAYPFMKRITWWPQAWLGIVFSWGALVGWPAVTGDLSWSPVLLWFGSIAWVVGYDTLYAIQDIEDDALVGVKSSARRLGEKTPIGVGIFYALAVILWGAALWTVRPDWIALLALVPAALHLAGQALRADPADGALALSLFRSNRVCGLLVCAAMLVVGLSAH